MKHVYFPFYSLIFILIFCFCNNPKGKIENKNVLNSGNNKIEKEVSSVNKVLPFHYENRTISFDTRLNDSITDEFIFDSGLTTDYCLFSKYFSELHGFTNLSIKNQKLHGVGNIHQISVIDSFFNIDVVGISKKEKFGIANLGYDEVRYAGILNVHLFKDSIVEFDFKNKLIKYHKYFSDNSYLKVNIIQRGNVRMIELEVSLNKTLKTKGLFIIDTGFKGFLYFFANKDQVKELISCSNSKKVLGAKNMDLKLCNYLISIPFVKIDSLRINYPIINYSNVELPKEVNNIVIGLVGNKFLECFNTVIDFKQNVMYLKQLHQINSMRESKLGITFYHYKTFKKVESIIEHSPAHKAGLQPNDIVNEVNGLCIKDYSEFKVDSLFQILEILKKPIILNCIQNGKSTSLVINP